MSLNFGDIFSDKTENKTQGGQTASQSYGMSPQVSEFWNWYRQQFDPSKWSPVGDNPWQTQAAGSMAGYAGGLMPSFDSASAIARGGIDPASIAAFQSPHTQQVVDAYQRNWEDQRGKTLAQNQSAAVKAGVPLMRSSQYGVNRALTEGNLEDTRSATVANLYNQGFQQASDMAAKSAGMKLSGAQAAAGIAGQQADITKGLFGMGMRGWEQAWRNSTMPWQLGQQFAGAFGSLVPLSGNNTSGTSWGNQTSTASPSPFSVGMGFAGLPLAAGWRPFGAASGGAITRDKAPGTAPPAPPEGNDPRDRLSKAFDTIHSLITRSRGGGVLKPFADGGAANGGWETTVTPASTMDWNALGKGMMAMGRGQQSGQSHGNDMALLGRMQANLSNTMASLTPHRMADGGVPEWSETGPQWGGEAPAAAEPRSYQWNEALPIERPGMGYVEPTAAQMTVPAAPGSVSREASAPAPAAKPQSGWFRGGIWSKDEEATPLQKFGLSLLNIASPRHRSPWAGVAASLVQMHDAALKRSMERRRMDMQADQFAKRLALERAGLLGRMADGTPTIAAKNAADRLAVEKGIATGAIDGVPTIASRQAGSVIASANLDRDIKQFQFDEMQHPENAVERRKAVAPKIGLKEGTPEYISFLATGKIPGKLLGAIDKDKISSEAELRKEVNAYAKDYTIIRDSAAAVNAIAEGSTPFSTIALIFSYMKLLDPGSVVREGEFATAQNAGSVPDRIYNLYNAALKGVKLNDDQIKDILAQAKKVAGTKRQFYENRLSQYKGVADRLNLDWRNIILVEPNERGAVPHGAPGGASGAPVRVTTPEEASKLPPGTRIILPDGSSGVVPERRP